MTSRVRRGADKRDIVWQEGGRETLVVLHFAGRRVVNEEGSEMPEFSEKLARRCDGSKTWQDSERLYQFFA